LKENIKKKNKIGILGGTFDPPHKGHLHISKISIKKLKLDKLIWVITKKNPLKKKPVLDLKDRINLSKKITRKEKKIFVKYFEDKINSKNTFSLLNFIKSKNKKSIIFFLAGADNLKTFHRWKNWQKITKIAKVAIFPRKGYSLKSLNSIVFKKLNKKDFMYINSKKVNISSSLIRKFW
jgi:nicotinate-nucleotide adenylyltransferase